MELSTRYDSLQEAVEMADEMDFEIESMKEYVSVSYENIDKEYGMCSLM
tara:strand:- start:3506 stop:3652 length:147 start_codon:yes stop_codon:yes gene_type:complete